MNRKKNILLGLLLIFLPQLVWSQVLDDSTKQIYGPNSTRFLLEKDIFDNKQVYHTIDTSLHNFHQYYFTQRYENTWVDLGEITTAGRNVFYKSPQQIGRMWGIQAYDPYFFSPNDIRYFDTKSPFTDIKYVIGTKGQQLINFEFSRNIRKDWNFGLRYRRIDDEKQFDVRQNKDERGESHALVVYTRFLSKNEKYQLLYHYSHLNQQIVESGGIQQQEGETKYDLFGYQVEKPQLLGKVTSWQTKNNHHLYQQYKISSFFQLYHIFDYKRQRDNYQDFNLSLNTAFYPKPLFNQDTTNENYVYRLYENRAGIKGKSKLFGSNKAYANYALYYKRRDFQLDNMYENLYKIKWESENYLGGQLDLAISDSSQLHVEGEYLLGRDYLANAEIRSPFFTGGIKSTYYSPTIIQRKYISNHFEWDNDFKNTLTNEIYGAIPVKLNNFFIAPFANYQLIKNYIYFTETIKEFPNIDKSFTPAQVADNLQILQVGTTFNFKWRWLNWENKVFYTKNLGADFIRFPKLLINSRLYFEGKIYKNALYGQIGIEATYKSSYLADKYMPVIKQFYYQNEFVVDAYPVIDVFMNLKIKHVRLFVKSEHLNQQWLGVGGYFTTPYYSGMPRNISLGFNWMFFD